MKPDRTQIIASLLIGSLLLTGFAPPTVAQSRPIVITFGQPNIWSLEQAHYLLNRMHRQNLDLQTAPLGTLDPNATNASRIDILKTLLQAGVSFDQAVGLNNELLRRDRVFNSDRRRQLLDNRTALQAESTQLAREISAMRIAKGNATTDAERAQIQSSIDAKTEQKAAVDNQLTQTNDEVKGLTSDSGEFQSATVPDMKPTALTGDLDEIIEKVALVNPSIAATLRLDNHIQLQYEIISKQLTLLRDEVGPGERLVFLELPQSINATQDRAEGKMAQTWWRIAGYTTVDKDKLLDAELEELEKKIDAIRQLIVTFDKEYNVDEKAKRETENAEAKTPLETQVAELFHEKTLREADLKKFNDASKAQDDAQKALTDAKKLERDAEAALEAAKKTGNQKQIRAAEGQLEKAKQSVRLAEENQKSADASYDKLFKSLNRDPQALKDAIQQLDEDIEDTRRAIRKIDDKRTKMRIERTRLSQAFTSLSAKYEKLRVEKIRNQIRRQNNVAERLIQGGSANTTDIVEKTLEVMPSSLKTNSLGDSAPERCKPGTPTEGRTYFNLEDCFPTPSSDRARSRDKIDRTDAARAEVKRRSVRTIDIIPRQNAINVQDTKQRLSRTGIFAAVSFLFGFAGKFTYERQRETAEQFLNQELFTSGFGKGDKDFGWSFYPFAGTKQLSSGVRTTYAVAIIPEDAETVILKARGCYFSRKKNQPLNYDDAGQGRWNEDDDADDALCTQPEQAFVLPIPGGSGDGADFYVTEVRYTESQQPGSRMIASIRGQNLPSQVAVFVDGVPLRQAVGLGQLNIESILDNNKVKDNCVRDLCGRFERIDENEIVISFEAGPNYEGTPRIEIIGPGKAIEINRLYLTINGVEDRRLDEEDPMFGSPPDRTLRRIGDFKVTPPPLDSTRMTGVLTGSRFKPDTDRIFINGSLATPVMTQPPGMPPPNPIKECRPDLCIVTFEKQETDFLTVTITPANDEERAVSKTFLNPTSLSIISASVVSYTPKEGSHSDVLTVKLDGSGFKQTLRVSIVKSVGPPVPAQMIVPSTGQMFLKIPEPEAVVQIEVVDPANNRAVRTVVVRPEPPPKEKKQ